MISSPYHTIALNRASNDYRLSHGDSKAAARNSWSQRFVVAESILCLTKSSSPAKIIKAGRVWSGHVSNVPTFLCVFESAQGPTRGPSPTKKKGRARAVEKIFFWAQSLFSGFRASHSIRTRKRLLREFKTKMRQEKKKSQNCLGGRRGQPSSLSQPYDP